MYVGIAWVISGVMLGYAGANPTYGLWSENIRDDWDRMRIG